MFAGQPLAPPVVVLLELGVVGVPVEEGLLAELEAEDDGGATAATVVDIVLKTLLTVWFVGGGPAKLLPPVLLLDEPTLDVEDGPVGGADEVLCAGLEFPQSTELLLLLLLLSVSVLLPSVSVLLLSSSVLLLSLSSLPT